MQARNGMFGLFVIKTHDIRDTPMYFNSKNLFTPLFSKIMGINSNLSKKIKKKIILCGILHTICCVITQYSVTVTP